MLHKMTKSLEHTRLLCVMPASSHNFVTDILGLDQETKKHALAISYISASQYPVSATYACCAFSE